ncbi:MAG: hypothetical protein SVU32_07150 [Candidatus Nanohaloarchaea archaeon]|nr:hypothetical protein [Candidatus Nanohaloarchaea archaeon]
MANRADITVEDVQKHQWTSEEVEELVERYQEDMSLLAKAEDIVNEENVRQTFDVDEEELAREEQGLYQKLKEYISSGTSSYGQEKVLSRITSWAEGRTGIDESDELATKIARKTFDDMDRDFYKLKEGGFKNVYVEESDREHKKIMYVPNRGDTFEERMEQVMTWQRNAEKLKEHDIPTAGRGYRVTVTEVDGEKMPVMLAETARNLDTISPKDHDPDESEQKERKQREQQAYNIREELFEMAKNGEYVTCEDRYGFEAGKHNLAYDKDRDQVVVVDLGELGATYFTDQTSIGGPFDAREDYLEQTGIKDRINDLTEQAELEDEYQQ